MTQFDPSHASSREEAELAALTGYQSGSRAPTASPVLIGLQQLDLSGRVIADTAGVSPPTVSKWRHGRAEMPSETAVFLSLVLASLIDEGEDALVSAAGAAQEWRTVQGRRLSAARLCLSVQERDNATVSPDVMRRATQRFRIWWTARLRDRLDGAALAGRLAS